jgi:hypothetical protein
MLAKRVHLLTISVILDGWQVEDAPAAACKSKRAPSDLQARSVLRGCVVIDKSFLIMVLACAMAPFLGVGIYLVVNLF